MFDNLREFSPINVLIMSVIDTIEFVCSRGEDDNDVESK